MPFKYVFVLSALSFFLTQGENNVDGKEEQVTMHESIEERKFDELKEKIVGGDRVLIEDIPFQVSLQSDGRHFCGGSLISSQYVLTAAHCVIRNKPHSGKLTVVYGYTYLDDVRQRHEVVYAIPHPDYKRNPGVVADIALLKLAWPALLDKKRVDTIPLAKEPPKAGDQCVTSGWGVTEVVPGDAPEKVSNQLRAVVVPVSTYEKCDRMTGLGRQVVCAGQLGKDSCQGDSGGPLACNHTLAGIVSWGIGCGEGFPGVYTSVANYSDWIYETMGSEDVKMSSAKSTSLFISPTLIYFASTLLHSSILIFQ